MQLNIPLSLLKAKVLRAIVDNLIFSWFKFLVNNLARVGTLFLSVVLMTRTKHAQKVEPL